jgi:peptide chain release factor 2
MIYGGLFDLDIKLERKEELSKIINDVGFWNREDKDSILKENNSLTNIIDRLFYVRNKIDSNLMILDSEMDDELLSLICEEYEDVNDNVSKLRIETYLSGEFDKNDCILEIHSGAGGTESCDWANMLYRMYSRYLSKNNYKVQPRLPQHYSLYGQANL